MRFNIKSATKYSSSLKNVICDVESSLAVRDSLISRYGGETELEDMPAIKNGLYDAVATYKKSKLNNETGKELTDEVVNVSTKNDFCRISPEKRLKILQDLIEERNYIDYKIEEIKNTSTIVDEFSGRNLTYDLGAQINNSYRTFKENILKPLVEMNSTLNATMNEKIVIAVGNGSEQTSINTTYPVLIEAKSLVNSSDILALYEDINKKCDENSAKLSEVEITKYFDYEPKFSLKPSLKGLISQYGE